MHFSLTEKACASINPEDIPLEVVKNDHLWRVISKKTVSTLGVGDDVIIS